MIRPKGKLKQPKLPKGVAAQHVKQIVQDKVLDKIKLEEKILGKRYAPGKRKKLLTNRLVTLDCGHSLFVDSFSIYNTICFQCSINSMKG